MPDADNVQGAVLPLKDTRVRDIIFYRYRRAHRTRPTWKQISQAIAEVRGKLLETWKGCLTIPNNPTFRVMLKAGELKESWVGSAGELLELLTAVNHHNGVLDEGETLPDNEDMMGIWPRDNFRRLCAHGVELCRPKRRAQKRLSAWRTVTPDDDTRDALTKEVSPNGATPKHNVENNKLPTDAHVGYTEEERVLLTIINGE